MAAKGARPYEGAPGGEGWASKDSTLNVGRVAPPNYQSPLTAGQVDDNAKFDEYLDFLRNKDPYIQALPINVEQRMFVRVLDSAQQPIAGARVQLYDGQRQLFDGRTVSDGRILFFPRQAGADNAQSFRAVVSRGTTQVEASLKTGVLEQSVTLGVPDNTGSVGLDIVFLMDATGSMGDEIDHVKATVDTIATRIEQLPGSSRPRLGLVAYRDVGDDYITRAWDFTDSVQQFSANLANVKADNGGDYPEAVVAGLKDALKLPGWADNSTGRRLRLVVLIADAPPHLDYPNDPAYPQLLGEAVASGIKLFPIGASGLDDQGEYIFRQFAQVTQGQFVFLTYANGVSGAPGPATTHSVSDFTVQNLDALVVKLVAAEVANQTGGQAGSQTQPPSVQAAIIPPSNDNWIASLWQGMTGQLVSVGTLFWGLLFAGFLFLGKRATQKARLATSAATPPVMQLNPPEDDPFPARARAHIEEDNLDPPSDLTILIGPTPEPLAVARVGGQHTTPLRRR
jgi:hypothetical protein